MTALLEAPEEPVEAPKAPEDRERFRATTVAWLSPAAILLIGLFLIPTGYAVYLGFTNLQLLGPNAQHFSFTGAANLNRLIHDPVFWSSVKITLIFVIGSGIIAQTLIGLALALLGQRAHISVRATVGSIVILAWVLPEIGVAFIWYAFGQSGGLLSEIIGNPSNDLLSTAPLLIVSIANAWRGTAFSMLILSAGLRNVPEEVDEAAQLEGAGYWRRLFRVTLPIMRPTIMTNMLLITIGTISDFTLIYAMTQGGPGNQTAILPVYMYIEAFQFNALGYGTTIALALIVIGALLSIVYVRQLRPELRKAS
ncbi:MAG: binding-protein-dependent transport system inner rane component [Acidimicrobiaceae bacterium]|nr:binding-protein-dependent transport system inner rane component [Acidimicrobiaceae bacterium]